MRRSDRRRFRRDPFRYLDDLRRSAPTGVIELPWGGRCVSDPVLATRLLRSPEFNNGPSGFFGELLPTRADQVAVGQAARNILRSQLPAYRDGLSSAVAELPASGRWPAAAVDLVYRSLDHVLVHPGTPDGVRRLLGRAASGGVILRPVHVGQRIRAEIRRSRLLAALTDEVERRRTERHEPDPPRDLLDAVRGACPRELADRTVAEVYLVLFRSILAPVSVTLAWSVLLACQHHPAGSPWPWPIPWVVREALRHRPMVWMVGRTLATETEFGGASFPPGDALSVSPFLAHHDQHQWADAEQFRPQRWAEPGDRGAYIPFGAGPFTCVGASVAQTLMVDALTELTKGVCLTIDTADDRPVLREGVVPRPFTLIRTPTTEGR